MSELKLKIGSDSQPPEPRRLAARSSADPSPSFPPDRAGAVGGPPELIHIDDPKGRERVSRREILRGIALGLTVAGIGRLDPASAQHVHEEVKRGKAADGTYTPGLFTEHEFKTVKRLAELIVPADEKGPSAADAGAAEFIDLLCGKNDVLAKIYTGGLSWMDARMRQDHETTFVEASESQQTALLDRLVEAERAAAEADHAWGESEYADFRDYGIEKRSDFAAGVSFFDWVRKMSIDAYYTSEAGVKDVGYIGNDALSEYTVPQEAIDFMMDKTGMG